MKYDFLVVGAGLFGAVFAQQMKEKGKTCLVIDRRAHIAGNVYSERRENIDVHVYGPHIFNTNSDDVWEYAKRFTKFNQFTHKVKVKYNDRMYSMPINMDTLHQLWGVTTPAEAMEKIEAVRVPCENPQNAEEWALSQVGPEIYNIFYRGYTKKQWKKDPKDLPASIFKRLPIRFTYDDRWHASKHSGIPADGYTAWVQNMLDGIPVELGVDYFKMNPYQYADRVVYTGRIDELLNYCYGELDYRTLRFDNKVFDGDFQGVPQVNYANEEIPHTRIVEHKHFNPMPGQEKTIVTWEYPETWERTAEPYYPIDSTENRALYQRYRKALDGWTDMVIGGRLGDYRYYDMDAVIASARKAVNNCT